MGDTDEYYRFFDENTSNGRILDVDLSGVEELPPKNLTAAESAARITWKLLRDDRLYRHYVNTQPRVLPTTTAELLLQRVAPPALVTQNPSTRYKNSAARQPRNPARIHGWDGFRNMVSTFQPSAPLTGPVEQYDIFVNSLRNRAVTRLESQEQNYLVSNVLDCLRLSGLVHYPEDQQTEHEGLLDHYLTDNDENLTMIIELKATHGLSLPMHATQVVQCHNNGRRASADNDTVVQDRERERHKERVCDPLGQLLRYMVSNGVRVGALSSAARTYFVRIEDEGETVAGRVLVSDAWFIGERDYLRAWAYCHALGADADRFVMDEISWADYDAHYLDNEGEDENEDENPEDDTEGENSAERSRKRPRSRSPTGGDPTTSVQFASIPFIPYKSISFEKVALGYGRNGCVFRAQWEGETVAVKQFDLGRPGIYQRFWNELSAYDLMKDAQGEFIPKARFWSKSRVGIAYLGLQLGRDPTEDDDVSSWQEVIRKLRTEYGFCHTDADRRNGLFIQDEHGVDRLVAIDLEEYSLTKKARRLQQQQQTSCPAPGPSRRRQD
jgi:hypothetical protein